jgi:hypothetical protein
MAKLGGFNMMAGLGMLGTGGLKPSDAKIKEK